MRRLRITAFDHEGNIVAQTRSPSDEKSERAIVASWLRTACRAKRACRISPVSQRSVTISLELAEKLAAWIGEKSE